MHPANRESKRKASQGQSLTTGQHPISAMRSVAYFPIEMNTAMLSCRQGINIDEHVKSRASAARPQPASAAMPQWSPEKAAKDTGRCCLDETLTTAVHSGVARRCERGAEGASLAMHARAQKRNTRRLQAWPVPPCPTMIGVYSFWPRICDCSPR